MSAKREWANMRFIKKLFIMKTLMLLFVLPFSAASFAAGFSPFWTTDGVTICAAVFPQGWPEIVEDGSGGAIIAWYDNRNGENDIYAQKVNSNGSVQWTADGVPVCIYGGMQVYVKLISDESGGAMMAWEDYRSGTRIYAQRMNSGGLAQWALNGVSVCAFSSTQIRPTISSDTAKGSIIVWEDMRNGNWDVYAQRVNENGVPQWVTAGVTICASTGNQSYHRAANDNAGGAIITWSDDAGDIFAQRVNASGSMLWRTNGTTVCAAANFQAMPAIVEDGSGGAILTWHDGRNGNWDIYAQKVNSSGAAQWAANGVAICADAGLQGNPEIASDGSGGAVIIWRDERSGNSDIYAQRIDYSGAVQWTTNGITICAAPDSQDKYQIAGDNSGGAIIIWEDSRTFDPNIYTQRVNSNGEVLWMTDGATVCAATNPQQMPKMIVDRSARAIIAWEDYRYSMGVGDIFAQMIGDIVGITSLEITINGRRFLDGDILPPNMSNTVSIKALTPGVVNVEMWLDGMSIPLSGPVGLPPVWSGTFTVTPDSSPLHILTFYASSSGLGGTFITLEAQVLTGGVQVVGVSLNYPNPFKPLSGDTTRIQYALSDNANVTVLFFDVTGQEVKRLTFTSGSNGGKAGINMVEWDGRSMFGEVVGNGMYIYKINIGSRTIGTGKLVVLD